MTDPLTPEQRAATPPDVLAILDALTLDLQRYERLVSRSPEFSAWEWCQGPEGGAAFGTEHPMMHLIMCSLAEQLDMTGAINRVSIKGHHAKAGWIECTVQRVGRLTPEDARRAAEGALERAVERLRAAGGEWDEPLAFVPSEPPVEEMKDPARPWLRFDFRRVPNVHRCLRCGREQAVPDPYTTATWEAVATAFGIEHSGCVEGDGAGAP